MTPKDIKKFRGQRNWTQSELAKKLGISLRKMQELERDGAKIDPMVRLAIESLRAEPGKGQRKMELDFQGLIQILAKNLYNKKDVFIRELIQNSHDACWRRSHRDSEYDIGQAAIDILPDLTTGSGRIIFRDNGEGMTEHDLVEFLSAVGRSGTKAARSETPEAIGHFGIGFLSGFVVASKIEVRTRHFTAKKGEACLWASEGEQEYSITQIEKERVGTEVTIYLDSAADKASIGEEAVRKAVLLYADMLKIPIYVNDPHHMQGGVNMSIMPWERNLDDAERKLEYHIYLEKRVPDSVLEVIPVDLEDTTGLLYITKTRVIGQDMPRTVRIFLRRMFLCEGADEILPPWASFINGIVTTKELEPNAARDNFMHDDKARDLQQKLGAIIIEHLEKLKNDNPDRLAEIISWHDFAIKAACHYHDEFYQKFVGLLEWRINPGAPFLGDSMAHRPAIDNHREEEHRITLPELLTHLPAQKGGGAKRLSYFSSHSARSQYFQMADAADTVVLDASNIFEEELLQKWAKSNQEKISLVRTGRQDDPNLFREIDPDKDILVRRLADTMSNYVRLGGHGRLDVVAKRIQPAELAAILKDEEQSQSINRARMILNDANASGETKRMAEELLRLSSSSDMGMVINAENPLVRGLARLLDQNRSEIDDDTKSDVQELMLGLYNSALLSNQQRMPAQNARLFHEQFQRLMQSIIDYATTADTARLENTKLAQDLERMRLKSPVRKDSTKHLRGFYITPFAKTFNKQRKAMRRLFEEKFFCQIFDATDAKYHGRIGANVRQHITDADFFIVDITGPALGEMNPNVMIELGAVDFGRPNAPLLVTGRVATASDKFLLPADIRELITCPYTHGATEEEWCKIWEETFRKDHGFKALLAQEGVEPYLSPKLFNSWMDFPIPEDVVKNLLEKFPSKADWENARTTEMKNILGKDTMFGDLSEQIKQRVLDKLGR